MELPPADPDPGTVCGVNKRAKVPSSRNQRSRKLRCFTVSVKVLRVLLPESLDI